MCFFQIFEPNLEYSIIQPHCRTPRIIMSSVGDRHISFVDNHNRLFMMGKNQHGQLGTSDKIDKTMPTQVLQDKFVRFVTCGVNHTIACVEKRDAQDVITGVELYGCGCNQENRLPHPTFTSRDMPNNDQFRKLHVPGLPWNIRQLESVKGMLFSMANYSPEQLYENTFNNYRGFYLIVIFRHGDDFWTKTPLWSFWGHKNNSRSFLGKRVLFG